MKVLIDTSVLVSGLMLGGPSRVCLELESLTRFVNSESLYETARLLMEAPFRLADDDISRIVFAATQNNHVLPPRVDIRRFPGLKNRSHAFLLEDCAEHRLDYLLTFSRDLGAYREQIDTVITTPAVFLRKEFPELG